MSRFLENLHSALLRKDGYLNPGGQTETTINALLAKAKNDEDEGDETENEGGDETDAETTPPPTDDQEPEEPNCTAAQEAQAKADAAQEALDACQNGE